MILTVNVDFFFCIIGVCSTSLKDYWQEMSLMANNLWKKLNFRLVLSCFISFLYVSVGKEID